MSSEMQNLRIRVFIFKRVFLANNSRWGSFQIVFTLVNKFSLYLNVINVYRNIKQEEMETGSLERL